MVTTPTAGRVAPTLAQLARSGEGERVAMGIPQVPAQVRRAPVLALRAVFAGFGRLVMLADRPASVVVIAEPVSRFRSLDGTGSVRLLRARDAQPAPDAPPAPEAGPATLAVADETSPPPDLPLPNYDELSLASIRARLRGLDIAQLKMLLDYEAVNAERTDVLGMFERRIEKLEAGS